VLLLTYLLTPSEWTGWWF